MCYKRNTVKFLLTILLSFSFLNVFAQNLVINSSFEDTISCPSNTSQINYAVGAESFCESPDYFNNCAPASSIISTPSNFIGYQIPATGNAYAGFGAYSYTENVEYVGMSLNAPLTIGVKYYLSFKIVLSIDSALGLNCAANKIGATFTTTQFTSTQTNCSNLKTNNPHFYSDSIYTDTLNWTKIMGSFVADSAYNYVAIGNFFDTANVDLITFFNAPAYFSYYYLDDVCLGTDSSFVYNCSYTTSIENNYQKESIKLYPNPINDILIIENPKNDEFDIDIYNSLGKVIYSSQNQLDSKISIDLSHIKSGLLIVRTNSSGRIQHFKVLKK